MNVFLIDLTHGGVKISVELAKSNKYEKIFAYDLYNTLKKEDETHLKTYNIKIIKYLEEFEKLLESNLDNKQLDKENKEVSKDLIINPIHSSLNIKNIINKIKGNNYYKIINHHEATKLVLENWKQECAKQDIKCIEITGVKGKTSTSFLLKEILLENNLQNTAENNNNILLLSSLGAYLFKKIENKENNLILQKNISITPANIIKTIELAEKIANPKCGTYPKCSSTRKPITPQNENILLCEDIESKYNNLNYNYAIFENSLGVCGLGDIGILTNIIENYPIAKGSSNAREAKKQVFNCPLITIDYKTLINNYSTENKLYENKINSFSIENKNATVYTEFINYDIDMSEIKIIYKNIKTINNKSISGNFIVNSFAPGKHHVLNLLTAVTTALSLEIDEKVIEKGLLNFKGIAGRTSQRKVKNSRIIEEINPGINTKAIESSINMINKLKDYCIIIGGEYGVTCEEIDENKLSQFLDKYLCKKPNTHLILTGELGKSIKLKLELINNSKLDTKSIVTPYNIKYIENYEEAQNKAINLNKNILFIYRSNYSQVSKR